jgi:flagellar hook-associated protein 1 FlgK
MALLGIALNSALKSLMANQSAMSVASNNIANANNPDYARQRLLTRPAPPDPSAWWIGTGVDVIGVQSIRDMLLETRYRHAISSQSDANSMVGHLGSVETIFNDANGTGLLQKITDFFNSFQTLSQDPASMTYREQVRSTANALINGIHSHASDLTKMQADANQDISSDLTQVNSLTQQIADITKQIRIEEASQSANDLRDRRTALVKQLSQYVEVNELDTPGGDYQLSTSDNHLLVLNDKAMPLQASDVTTQIGSGSLRAAVDIRDNYVPKYMAALDQLTYEISQQVNSIHSAGYDLNGNTGIDFFTPLASAAGAASQISLSVDVAGDPSKIAASSLATGNDNGTAVALGNLLTAPVFSGGTVTDQYNTLVYSVGSDVATAQSNDDEQSALVTQLENRRQDVSGVSIDEESLQIQQFQRAYEASAQVVQVIDQLLDVTLGMVNSTTQ